MTWSALLCAHPYCISLAKFLHTFQKNFYESLATYAHFVCNRIWKENRAKKFYRSLRYLNLEILRESFFEEYKNLDFWTYFFWYFPIFTFFCKIIFYLKRFEMGLKLVRKVWLWMARIESLIPYVIYDLRSHSWTWHSLVNSRAILWRWFQSSSVEFL